MSRNPTIDAMRGLSILSVILLHLYIHFPFENHLPHSIFAIVFESGYYGVIVFFVISGFLITRSILNKWQNIHAVKLVPFYRMRFARIMPCLVALIFFLSILDILAIKGFIIHTTTLPQTIFAALTFHINYLEAKTGYLPGAWDILWSLSIEEVFYIIFPLLCLLIKNQRLLIFTLILIIVAGPFSRTVGSNEIWQDHAYFSCIDGIAFGILAALFSIEIPPQRAKNFLWGGLSLFIIVFFFRHFVYDIGLSAAGLNVSLLELSIALILITIDQNPYKLKKLPLLSWYGQNSYEIYLTHMLLITGLALVNLNIWITYALGLAGSGWLGACVAKYYSKPLNCKIRNTTSL